MPKRPVRLPDKMKDDVVRGLVFETFGQIRFTQDTPIMPQVWTEFIRAEEERARQRILRGRAKNPPLPSGRVDLLITPWKSVSAGKVAEMLRARVGGYDKPPDKVPPAVAEAEIAPGWTHVAARLDFVTAIRTILPLTDWWLRLPENLRSAEMIESIVTQLGQTRDPLKRKQALAEIAQHFNGWEQLRFIALAGFVLDLCAVTNLTQLRASLEIANGLARPARPGGGDEASVGDALIATAKRSGEFLAEFPPGDTSKAKPAIFAVNKNRTAATTIFDSRQTVKADAANQVFQITTEGISWAVIDVGIDAGHPAFQIRREPASPPPAPSEGPASSRIVATYDFTNLRRILATGQLSANPKGWPTDVDVARMLEDPNVKTSLDHIRVRNDNARDLDWTILEPLIRIPHDGGYRVPQAEHGTHVAGIIAADWPDAPTGGGRPLRGICPDLALYDLRVFTDDGESEEFAIIAALEFVNWLNRDRVNPAVHGVNLSLGLVHQVDAFACGRTPVCDVCDELVGAGTVVVASAGNTGFEASLEKLSLGTGYRTMSITDPGNAEQVITVGAVHKSHPHAYGVSYFSSRGPTGDGRRKPDLVAPGEKIESTVPGPGTRRLDGTSMAAPHVSGAAALLMSRHRELVGRPRRIKEILMATATDLGREPFFQGAGLVDILRALQSV